MSVRDRTSIELPRALSGSNELMAWPAVESTRTVPGSVTALAGLSWADAVPIGATKQKMEIAAAAPFSNNRAELRFSTRGSTGLNPLAIVPPLRTCFRHSIENAESCVKILLTGVKESNDAPDSCRGE